MTHAEQEKYILPLASISIVFYSLLAIISGWFFHKFNLICARNQQGHIYRSNMGKFDEAKWWFFLLLTMSAVCDIPLYVGCVIEGSPNDCEWDSASYAVFWFLHLCAVCGYAYTIIIPCLLWSDMINRKDGKLFISKYPSDNTKRFFQVSLLCYIALTICNIIFGGLYYRVSDHVQYTENFFYMMCTLLEPVFICAIALGCLWCGIRLQLYVRRAKLGLRTEIRFLLHMNITMAIITSTYLARGVLILRLVAFLPESFRSRLHTSYFVWLLCTRWLPYIFCSFCLIFMMRASGEEVAQRRGTLKEKSYTNSGDMTNQIEASPTGKSNALVNQLVTLPGVGNALVSAIYNPQDYNNEANIGENSSHHSSLLLSHSQIDYFDDESMSYSILSDRALDEPGRTVSTGSSNPSVDIITSTPDTGSVVHNRLQPPQSGSSMQTGYSPPPHNNMWNHLRNQPPAVHGRILQNNLSPAPSRTTQKSSSTSSAQSR